MACNRNEITILRSIVQTLGYLGRLSQNSLFVECRRVLVGSGKSSTARSVDSTHRRGANSGRGGGETTMLNTEQPMVVELVR